MIKIAYKYFKEVEVLDIFICIFNKYKGMEIHFSPIRINTSQRYFYPGLSSATIVRYIKEKGYTFLIDV